MTPRRRTAFCSFVLGAAMSLVFVAIPLWVVGSGEDSMVVTDATPLAALSTAPAVSPHFDISAILEGEWRGEVCPDEGPPLPVAFEFARGEDGAIAYSLTIGDQFADYLSSGACDVDGENIAFHSFLAILNECDEACGVDRLYWGHFEDGSLVGDYRDEVADEACLSCVGGGTWWLAPEQG